MNDTVLERQLKYPLLYTSMTTLEDTKLKRQ